ncbi:MAG: hypothetical protein IKT00_04350 [Prevotella sp.]|nr:hypothetical protein [Prevotella sp.]
MKRIILGMFIMLMGMFAVSCSSDNPEAKLKSLVEQVKADGAKWDAAKWKSVVMEAIEAVKPMAEKMKNLALEAEKDPSKLAEIMKIGEENANIQQLFSQIMEEASKSSVASTLENDAELKAAAEALEMD